MQAGHFEFILFSDFLATVLASLNCLTYAGHVTFSFAFNCSRSQSLLSAVFSFLSLTGSFKFLSIHIWFIDTISTALNIVKPLTFHKFSVIRACEATQTARSNNIIAVITDVLFLTNILQLLANKSVSETSQTEWLRVL